MRKQLVGFAFILFGILLVFAEMAGGSWLPVIGSLPLVDLAILSGIIGLVTCIREGKE